MGREIQNLSEIQPLPPKKKFSPTVKLQCCAILLLKDREDRALSAWASILTG